MLCDQQQFLNATETPMQSTPDQRNCHFPSQLFHISLKHNTKGLQHTRRLYPSDGSNVDMSTYDGTTNNKF